MRNPAARMIKRRGRSSGRAVVLVAVLTALALLAAACAGTQPRDLVAAGATGPQVGGESVQVDDALVDADSTIATVAAGPSAGTKQSPGTKKSGPASGPVAGSTGGGGASGQAGPAPLTASDTGVSATEIKFGSISEVSFPLGNLIVAPITTAVQATMRSVNDTGGVLGRKMSIQDCDSGGDATRFRACYRKLVEEQKIFAFITSATWGTGEVHGELAKDEIPWVGSWGFFTSEAFDPWMFPIHMATIHEAHNVALWSIEVLKPKTVGIVYFNIPEEKLAVQALKDVYGKAGVSVVREIPQEVETADESGNVLSMRSANPDVINYFTHPAAAAKFIIDASSQGYWPPMGMIGNHLTTEAAGELLGEYPLRGLWAITTVKYHDHADDYLAIMDKYAPQMRNVHHHITQGGYSAVKLFTEAAKQVGPNLTRKELVKVLESRQWDAGAGLGQTFIWNPGDHDNLRCEYMYKFNSTETGSYKVWQPDPTKYEICDTVD